ncbi:MAG: hypothetical protein OXC91_01940 [Rhodobacteraceae bacterium]|nr:hypothetical protein [Paracoccaceae bacterium]
MTGDRDMEIYRQRYETFRHLDRLRWQMLQLLIALISGTALVLKATTGPIGCGVFSLLGIALVLVAFVMHRISSGLRKNGRVLQQIGRALGDHEIPDISNPWHSIAHWLMLLVGLAGIGLAVWSGWCWLRDTNAIPPLM